MPTAKPAADRPTDQGTPSDAPQPPEQAPEKAPQAYEYTAPFSTVYPPVPLTAHPAAGKQPATVFAWPDGAPDLRWQPTDKAPNQRPDNEPAQPTEA